MQVRPTDLLRVFVHVLLPLVIGVLVYHFFTDRDILLTRIMEQIMGNKGDIGLEAPGWVRYHLQDGLWPYAFASTILIIHDRRLNSRTLPWLTIAVGIPIFLEVIQLFDSFKGTFDPLDLIWSLGGSTASILILTTNSDRS